MSITLPPLPERNPRSYKWTEREKQELRARDLEVARVVLEGAAKACHGISALHYDEYKGRAKHPGGLRAYDPYLDGLNDGAGECADAIRALEVRHHD